MGVGKVVSIYGLKSGFQDLLRPAEQALARGGVSANQVTIAAVALCAAWAAGAMVIDARWWLLLLPPVLLARMALNALDGMLAREHGQASKLGAVLNEAGDLLGDALCYLPLVLLLPGDTALLLAVIALGLLGEVVGIAAQAAGGTRAYDGPLGKPDRAFAFSLFSVIAYSGVDLLPIAWNGLYALLIALALLTAWNRLRAQI
jgi:CDP-diacylglycerol--glycerol-3-phosphate 3-phosphatidyltransferase